MGVWLRFLPFVKPQAMRLAAIAALAVAGVMLQALLPWPVKLIVDHVLSGLALPAWLMGFMPPSVTGSPELLLGLLAAGLFLLFLLSQGVALLYAVLHASLAARMQYALAAKLFDHLQALSPIYLARAYKGDLARKILTDTVSLPAMIMDAAVPAVTSALTLLVFFVIMWRLDPVLALIACGAALPMVAAIKFFGPRMSERAYEHQEAEGAVWSAAEQSLTALPVVQAFGREAQEARRFRGFTTRSRRAYLRSIFTQIEFKVGVDGGEAVGVAAVMIVGGFHVLNGTITVGTLIVFLSYLAALYAPLNALAYLSTTVAEAAGSARRVANLLNVDEMVREVPGACALARLKGQGGARVAFEGVAFAYESGRPVLHGIDLELAPGTVTALIGATGAGKTTLAGLIPRLFDPSEGRVLIDGQDIRSATLASVREQVTMVLQEPLLLPISIAENIAYSRPSASREEVVAAAAAAHADGFIRNLPQGYDTIIGERGATLSGGQRQRLAIARALLKDASILILDEPTSALDTHTEELVMAALQRLFAGRTALIIAHRLSTARRADRIVVMERGRIVESGTHQSLMRARGAYRRLYLAQHPPAAEALEHAQPQAAS